MNIRARLLDAIKHIDRTEEDSEEVLKYDFCEVVEYVEGLESDNKRLDALASSRKSGLLEIQEDNKRLLARVAELEGVEKPAQAKCVAPPELKCVQCGEYVKLFKYDFNNAKCVKCVEKSST